MTPDEIDKWKPEQIGEVFRVCQSRQQTCEQTSEQLKSPGLFSTWDGAAASAAEDSAHRQRVDIDAHGTEAARVGAAASRAEDEAGAVKSALQDIRDLCASEMLMIDNATGTVHLTPIEAGTYDVDRQNDVAVAQSRLNKVMFDADTADRDLAIAIQAATGVIPIDALPTSSQLPTPEKPDHLPGKQYRPESPVQIGPRYPTGSTRVLPIEVPKGWSDPSMTSTLAQQYARPITIDPSAPGASGDYSGNEISPNPITGGGVGIPAIGEDQRVLPSKTGRPETGAGRAGGSLEADITQQHCVRVVGANPVSVGSVDVDGKNYMTVTYQYEYEADRLRTVGINGIDLPTNNAPDWKPITTDEAINLADHGVRLPDPGAAQ